MAFEGLVELVIVLSALFVTLHFLTITFNIFKFLVKWSLIVLLITIIVGIILDPNDTAIATKQQQQGRQHHQQDQNQKVNLNWLSKIYCKSRYGQVNCPAQDKVVNNAEQLTQNTLKTLNDAWLTTSALAEPYVLQFLQARQERYQQLQNNDHLFRSRPLFSWVYFPSGATPSSTKIKRNKQKT